MQEVLQEEQNRVEFFAAGEMLYINGADGTIYSASERRDNK